MEQEGYQCHICYETATRPVVTPCGHLFCWPCIYKWLRSNQEFLSCPTCKSGLQISMLRPILIPGQPPEKTENGVPPRPRPIRKNRKKDMKEKESQQFKQIPQAIKNISMNMYRGVLLGGYGLFPSCYTMLRQNLTKILPEQNNVGQQIEYKYSMKLEFWSFIFGIFCILLLIFW